VIGNCQFNDTTPAACDTQPDGRIRRIGRRHMVGDDIYNTTGVNQSRTANLRLGQLARFVITIQNDSAVTDSFTVGANSGFPCAKFSCVVASNYPDGLTFFHGRHGADITADVLAGTYTTPALAPGAIYRIRAVFLVSTSPTVNPSVGATIDWQVTATSVGNPVNSDTVAITINVEALG
jgi:hypothetical protein